MFFKKKKPVLVLDHTPDKFHQSLGISDERFKQLHEDIYKNAQEYHTISKYTEYVFNNYAVNEAIFCLYIYAFNNGFEHGSNMSKLKKYAEKFMDEVMPDLKNIENKEKVTWQ